MTSHRGVSTTPIHMKPWQWGGGWALVTGASAGLGVEFAGQLARRGTSLVLSARRADRLQALAEELRGSYPVEVVVVPADLSRPEEPLRLWRTANEGRDIDLLINNAGFGARGRVDAVPLDRLLEMLRLNCSALLELTHHALQEMRSRRHGGIINVASLAAYQPVPQLATYAASKAFVLSFTEAVAAENRSAGVRVLALSPGRTPTEFQEVAGTGDATGSFGARSPAEVVAAGLRAFEKGRISVVPGMENRLASIAGRLVPRRLLIGVLRPIVERAAMR